MLNATIYSIIFCTIFFIIIEVKELYIQQSRHKVDEIVRLNSFE